jgi:hypothetical protein
VAAGGVGPARATWKPQGLEAANVTDLLSQVPVTVLLQKPVLRHCTVAVPPQTHCAVQVAPMAAPAQLPGHAPLLMGLVGTEGQLVGATTANNKQSTWALSITNSGMHIDCELCL